MAHSLSTIALYVASPALASILAATLAAQPGLRVRAFESRAALLTYTGLSRADLVILDFDSTDPADEIALALRAGTNAPSSILALASSKSGDLRATTLRAGIDEVLMKPMSPKYLLERVAARLAAPRLVLPVRADRRRATSADWSRHGANIVPLFGTRPEPRLGA